jgi:hypothetical protein
MTVAILRVSLARPGFLHKPPVFDQIFSESHSQAKVFTVFPAALKALWARQETGWAVGRTACRRSPQDDGGEGGHYRGGEASLSAGTDHARVHLPSGTTLGSLSQVTVMRVWHKVGLQPHRLKRYMASPDPDFEAKNFESSSANGSGTSVSGRQKTTA